MVQSSAGRLICFEGTDGAGKTTTAHLFAQSLSATGIQVIFIEKKSLEFPTEFLKDHMAGLKRVLWDYPPDGPIETLGNDHWLHLMASWFSVLDFCRVRPAVAEGKVVVVDNWFYKFAARFSLKPSLGIQQISSCFSHISAPDDVILLDTRPEVAVVRREAFSRTESGAFDGSPAGGKDGFMQYQARVRDVLLRMARDSNWHVLDTAGLSVDQVVERALSAVALRP